MNTAFPALESHLRPSDILFIRSPFVHASCITPQRGVKVIPFHLFASHFYNTGCRTSLICQRPKSPETWASQALITSHLAHLQKYTKRVESLNFIPS